MPNSKQRRWTRDELLLAFSLYCRMPFGRLHQNNPEIQQLAEVIERTPGAVAMKACNFASLDPAQQARDIKGLSNASKADEEIWNEFHADWELLAYESQRARQSLVGENAESATSERVPLGETERETITRVRLVQDFFRQSVLSIYLSSCAICELGLPELLNASHIIPWRESERRRADPTNGLCLCALHDRAFDRGLLAVDEHYSIIVSTKVKCDSPCAVHKVALIEIDGGKLRMPDRFHPDPEALEFHRTNVFQQ